MLETLAEVFFRVREIFFYSQKFCESCILWIIFIVKGYHILPWGPAGEWYRTIAAKLPKVRLSHGFATAKYHGLEAHPCTCRWCCLTLLSKVSRNKVQTQQPSFHKWGFARAKHQGPWCLLFFWCPPCWWLGIKGISWYFRESFAKEWAKVKVHFEVSGPVSHAKNCLISNNLSWEGDSVMVAACLQGYEEVIIRDNFVWMNHHKRSCCSTWVPRKVNMDFAKNSGNMVFIAKNGRFRLKEFGSTIVYIYRHTIIPSL